MAESVTPDNAPLGFPFRLPQQDVIVTTDVDRLITLLREKKELPLKDISDELGIVLETVESWVSFLEEEGLVTMSYKFTTPYVYYKGEEGEEDEEEAEKKPEAAQGFFSLQQGDQDAKDMQAGGQVQFQPGTVQQPGVADTPRGEPVDFTKWVSEAYQHIDAGDMHKAHKVYRRVWQYLEAVPTEHHEHRKEVEHHLLKLNRELSLLMVKAAKQRADEVEDHINELLTRIMRRIRGGDLRTAEQQYSMIEKQYGDFPDELLMRKLQLQLRILEVHKKLASKKRDMFEKDKGKIVDMLLQSITQYRDAVALKDENGMRKSFDETRDLYFSVPHDVLDKSAELKKEIRKTFPQLVTQRDHVEKEELEGKEGEIRGLIIKAGAELEKGNVLQANLMYNRMNAIFSYLPNGFLHEKLELVIEMQKLHASLLPLLIDSISREFNDRASQMDKQLSLALRYLNKGKLKLAQDVYKQVSMNFNTLPQGFIEEMTNLRIQMLTLYKELLIRSDISLLEHLSKPDEQLYSNILSILVKVHAHIENEEFALISTDYRDLSALFERMPEGKEKLHLEEEIGKVGKMNFLYQTTCELERLNPSDHHAEEKLRTIKKLYTSLMVESPEDVTLFRHVYRVYSTYLEAMKEDDLPSTAGEGGVGRSPRKMVSGSVPDLMGQAILLLNEGRYDQAKDVFESILLQDPTNMEAKRLIDEVDHLESKEGLMNLLIKLKLDRAKYAMSIQDIDTTRKNLREILELSPHHSEAKRLLGTLRGHAKPAANPKQARQEEENLEKQKEAFLKKLLLKEAKMAMSEGKPVEAEKKLRRLLEMDENHAEGLKLARRLQGVKGQ